jgi:hypothetical protein
MTEAAVRRIVIALLTALGAVLGCSVAPAGVVAGGTSPGRLQPALSGVSCVPSSYCVAVGARTDSAESPPVDVPLAMIGNGSRWHETAVPQPKGRAEGRLDSVSCVSASYCVAVGGYGSGGSGGPLAETWNGRAWTAAALPWPAGVPYSGVAAVSCAVARGCVVTFDGASADLLTGTTWTHRAEPMPKRGSAGALWGVSCVRSAYCVLAGDFNRNLHDSPLFELWNGRTFAAMKTGPYPGPPGASIFINAVACTSASSCVAVGPSIAARWNGMAWSFATPAGRRGFQNGLLSVSCGSPSSCLAVGAATQRQVYDAQAMSYDGRSWTVTNVPALPHGDMSQFVGVSCVSRAHCVAVGGGWSPPGPPGTPVSGVALIGSWNGNSWRLVTVS